MNFKGLCGLWGMGDEERLILYEVRIASAN
jgi:hypothetical protein